MARAVLISKHSISGLFPLGQEQYSGSARWNQTRRRPGKIMKLHETNQRRREQESNSGNLTIGEVASEDLTRLYSAVTLTSTRLPCGSAGAAAGLAGLKQIR